MQERSTRGKGLLEPLVAKLRHKAARERLPKVRSILDVACGAYPVFLSGINAPVRVGIDALPAHSGVPSSIRMVQQDLQQDPKLPFEDSTFQVVTALAFLEHIDSTSRQILLQEIYRVLEPGGIFLFTTPHPRSEIILRGLSRARLLSPEEINDHKVLLDTATCRALLNMAGFQAMDIDISCFELGMNIVGIARKNLQQ